MLVKKSHFSSTSFTEAIAILSVRPRNCHSCVEIEHQAGRSGLGRVLRDRHFRFQTESNMDDLKYDDSMNMRKNRLETFVDWPFNDEGSNCTAEKV